MFSPCTPGLRQGSDRPLRRIWATPVFAKRPGSARGLEIGIAGNTDEAHPDEVHEVATVAPNQFFDDTHPLDRSLASRTIVGGEFQIIRPDELPDGQGN